MLGSVMEISTTAAAAAPDAASFRDVTMPRLLVIDPMPLTRAGLVGGLNDAAVAAVTAVGSIDEVSALATLGATFDAAVLNLGNDPVDDAALAGDAAAIRAAFPGILLLLLTCQSDVASISAALRLGVRGYFTTDRSLDATLEAIRMTCSGWTIYPALEKGVLSDIVTGQRRAVVQTAPLGDHSALTPRQSEVFNLLATGMPNKRIAAELMMCESTVKAHIKGIMQRLGARNRTEVVAILCGTVVFVD